MLHLHTLGQRLAQAAQTQPESAERVARAALDLGVELPGDPWARWLLVALHRHIPRQRWVGRIVEQHLNGDLARLATDGALGAPVDRPQAGPVPGLEGWSYFFHGIGCCLTHDDGTAIDVDIDENGADAIDPWFYQRYLDSLPEPEGIEAPLKGAGGTAAWWMADLRTLKALKLITGEHRVVLTASGQTLAGALAPLLEELARSESPLRRAWLAVLLGDFVRASDELASLAVPASIQAAAQAQVSERISRLSGPYEPGDAADLRALARLGRQHAEKAVLAQLHRSPLDGVTSVALDIIEDWSDPRFVEPLLDVAERATGEVTPEPHVRATACRLALRSAVDVALSSSLRGRLVTLLATTAGHAAGESAYMLALLDPGRGLQRLAEVLSSDIPLARQEAAAGLALLGTEDALEILGESSSREARLLLRAVEGEAPEPHAEPREAWRETWIEWRGERRRVYTMEDILEASLPSWMASCLERLRRRYASLATGLLRSKIRRSP
ncbi:hypothetical protein WME98_49780 [Sorangium sp. So ce296]|uniref:DUF6896 domain-containing protein n=1 Tax=Sorangium sp. So ce296 TaxID=3133296 RepID=UPI003F5DCA57